ncbi:MAG: hypothetical protein J6B51_08360 [Clostridia bacterium]|nr:hypothetical protein [Clostridia bacterium]
MNNRRNIFIAIILTFVITLSLFSFVSCSLIDFRLHPAGEPVEINDNLTEIKGFIE